MKPFLTTEQFIKKARAVHGDRFDYSKVIYLGRKNRIIIICPIHGEFLQRPDHHLQGHSCTKCRSDKITTLKKLSQEEFIKRSNIIHNNFYSYLNAIYTGIFDKLIITCPIHGDFEQTPANHINHKQGCPNCKASKGELAIKAILDKHNIKYVREFMLPEIVSLLKYDFYLPDHNLLIEFHGGQHYNFIPYFHETEDNFLKQKERDIFKKDFAHRFKYKFLEFNYKQLRHMKQHQFEELILNKIK